MKDQKEHKPVDGADEALHAEFDERMALIEKAVRTYHEFLLCYAISLCRGHMHDAQALVSDLWRYVIVNFAAASINSPANLKTKLYFLFLDKCRARQRNREVQCENYQDMPLPAKPYQPCSEAEEAAFAQNFWAEFPGIALTDKQKQALILNVRLERPITQISKELGASPSTVAGWISKAKQEVINYMNSNRD